MGITGSDSDLPRLQGRRAGSLRRLERIISVVRAFDRKEDEAFTVWQGLQYLRDMFDGRGALEPLDNARYPELRWTSVRDVLAADHRLAGG